MLSYNSKRCLPFGERMMRKTTEETRNRILEAARQEMLSVGYQNTSMRKIAAAAGITAGALYKHFAGKEEIFETICDGVIESLFAAQKSLLVDNLKEASDEALLQLFRKKISVQMLMKFADNFPVLYMIVQNGSTDYYERKKAEYLKLSVSYAVEYYNELYRRGLINKSYTREELYMLSQAEFLALCTFLERSGTDGRIDEADIKAYETLLSIVSKGIQADCALLLDD